MALQIRSLRRILLNSSVICLAIMMIATSVPNTWGMGMKPYALSDRRTDGYFTTKMWGEGTFSESSRAATGTITFSSTYGGERGTCEISSAHTFVSATGLSGLVLQGIPTGFWLFGSTIYSTLNCQVTIIEGGSQRSGPNGGLIWTYEDVFYYYGQYYSGDFLSFVTGAGFYPCTTPEGQFFLCSGHVTVG